MRGDGVIYQVYPRSFADSNGDGIGDIPGIVANLDHLAWLGVDAIWTTPTFPSPNVDWGYDVSDYRGVHPELGTMDDLDTLIAEAKQRGIEIWLDLVPNHTSDRHAWFSDRPEYYVWSNEIPNDWKSIFTRGSAWQWDERRKQYYLHQFAPQQPDLDWWNVDVHAEFDQILRFWFDRGVAGWRIDVAHGLVYDRELRDGIEHMRERPEVHDIYRSWQKIAAEYDPKPTLMGETVVKVEKMFAYYQGLDLAQNFDFCAADFTIESMRPIVEKTMKGLPPGATPNWFGGNHDHSADGDALGRRRRAQGARSALPRAHAARRGDPLPGRRDRARGRRRAQGQDPRHRPTLTRRGAHAAPVDGQRGGVARAVAPARKHESQRRRPASRREQHAALRA